MPSSPQIMNGRHFYLVHRFYSKEGNTLCLDGVSTQNSSRLADFIAIRALPMSLGN